MIYFEVSAFANSLAFRSRFSLRSRSLLGTSSLNKKSAHVVCTVSNSSPFAERRRRRGAFYIDKQNQKIKRKGVYP
jgi:hypothetical protein